MITEQNLVNMRQCYKSILIGFSRYCLENSQTLFADFCFLLS